MFVYSTYLTISYAIICTPTRRNVSYLVLVKIVLLDPECICNCILTLAQHTLLIMSRKVFSTEEKRCLQELIIKYKLNCAATIGPGNQSAKKTAWAQLTNEFNSLELNRTRTESQLKKCFDNMKSRRKSDLTAQKKQRMRTGGGVCRPSPEPSTSTAQDSLLVDEVALAELTNLEMMYAIDSDSAIPTTGSQQESVPPPAETVTVYVEVQDQLEKSCNEEVLPEGPNPDLHEAQPGTGQRRSVGERTSSRLSDFNRAGGRNIRTQVIQEEFSLREDSYKKAQEREEELHKLKVAEREWLVKAAEEIFKKACLEREAAQIILENLKNK